MESTLAAKAATTDGDEANNGYDDDCAECWQPHDVDGGDGNDDGLGRRDGSVNVKHERRCRVVMCAAERAGMCVRGLGRYHQKSRKQATRSKSQTRKSKKQPQSGSGAWKRLTVPSLR